VLALDWLAAHEHRGSQRADALRDVGDRCLLIAGRYPGLAERRRVDPDYFRQLGCGAYAGVAESAQAGYAALFAALAQAFGAMVRVLAALAPTGPMAAPALIPVAHRTRSGGKAH
jgi:hypothetical protein